MNGVSKFLFFDIITVRSPTNDSHAPSCQIEWAKWGAYESSEKKATKKRMAHSAMYDVDDGNNSNHHNSNNCIYNAKNKKKNAVASKISSKAMSNRRRDRSRNHKNVNLISHINCTCLFLFVNASYTVSIPYIICLDVWILYGNVFERSFSFLSLRLCISLVSLCKWFLFEYFFSLCSLHWWKSLISCNIRMNQKKRTPINWNLAIWYISAMSLVACGTMKHIHTYIFACVW